MTIDKGLRSFFPGVRTPDEIKEQEDARAAIKAKLNKLQAANLDSEDLSFLQMASSRPFVKEPPVIKDEYGFTPSENKQIENY